MRVVDTIFRARDDAALIGVLSEIPGGADLLAWFGGHLPSLAPSNAALRKKRLEPTKWPVIRRSVSVQ